jgi:hypothetical protein
MAEKTSLQETFIEKFKRLTMLYSASAGAWGHGRKLYLTAPFMNRLSQNQACNIFNFNVLDFL